MARTTTTTRVRTTPYSLDKAKLHTKSKPTLTPDSKDPAEILSREDRTEALETNLKGGKERPSGGYDKHRLVLLVIKDAKPDWEAIARQVGKTPTQCKDTWRKTIQPALQANKPWSTTGSGWTKEMKMTAVNAVLEASKPDWTEIANTFKGKTPTQIKDVWRKVILPRLKRGETLQ